MIKTYFIAFACIIFTCSSFAQTVSGELRKWHAVTIEFTDDGTYTETGTPNPFLDRRLNVTFTAPSGNTYLVPGYFAADGNAAETSANSGNKWHVRFTPDETGTWSYSASFREGSNVAVTYPASPTNGSAGFINGQGGTFNIISSNKSGRDFRGKGRLQYTNERYLKFAETGEYFVKAGADSPETLLAYDDFDNTSTASRPIKSWSPHNADYNSGDNTWQGTKGRELVGALNYLSEKGMNAFSFLTMNVIGDGRNVWPWAATAHSSLDGSGEANNRRKYDVSKLAQWDLIFSHADKVGLFLHFKTQETENDQLLDGGNLGTSRKLYYRELIARFGYHLALNWNLGEENTQTTQQRLDMIDYFYNTDPYRHPIVIHNSVGTSAQNNLFNPLIGSNSELSGVSLQTQITNIHDQILGWVEDSETAGKPWIVASDEQGSASTGVTSDASYGGNKGSAADNRDAVRKNVLWGTLMAGGHGVEYYFGSNTGETDMVAEDFRSRDIKWDDARHALDFFTSYLPYWQMSSNDGLNSDNDNYCFAKIGEIYAVYVDTGSSSGTLDIGNTGDSYDVKWYNPRSGGALQNGSVTSVTSNGTPANLGNPPSQTSEDWIVLLEVQGAAQPNIEIDDTGINEGEDAVFTVTLNTAVSGGFSVDFTTQDDTAIEGEDYDQINGTLNFTGTAGETRTITVPTTDDSIIEVTEEFFVILSNVVGASVDILDGQGTATISDNDIANISIDDVNTTEGGQVVFTVTLDNAVSGGFSVDYATSENTALSDIDYEDTSGVLNFNGTANETQTISVNTLEDAIVEPQESFYLDLSNIQGAIVNIADPQGEATIDDDDSASITIDDISIEEGNNANFSVTLDNEVSGGFSVNYATENNTAIAGSDYDSDSGTLNFSGTVGEIQIITITTTDDALNESDEEFFLNLLDVFDGDVQIADNQGVATITDNDSGANLSIDDVTVTEGGNAVFTITLDNNISPAFTVDYSTENISALSGEDYTSDSGFVSFTGNAGETQTITISTIDDAVLESIEQFAINITTSATVTILDGQGVGTINDDDTADLSINNANATEGNSIVFTVTLDNAVSGGFSVDYGSASNTASSGFDFTGVSGTLNFTGTAGETQTITVITTDDAILEGTETFYVDLSNATDGVGFSDAQGLGSITDNDSASVSISDVSVSEGNSAVLVVTLDNAVSNGFSLDFDSSGNTAIQGTDFTANSGTINFVGTAGETQSITVNTTDDSIVEADETFFVNLSNASNGVSISDGQGLATITDNDNANISINNTTVTEGSTAVLTVSVDNAVDGGFSVDFNSAGNTAIQGVDFSATSGVLNFIGNAGETRTINVNTINDAAIEGTESFFINLSNATNGIGIADSQAVITLVDDDSANIFVSDSSIEEGGILVLDVSLSSAVGGGFSVDFSTAGNTATAGSDYTTSSGTLNFAGNAGETQTISVTTLEDALVEGTESFFVNLTNATNGVTIADGQGIGAITDNDNASITINNTTIEEGGTAILSVTLDNTISGGFSVDFSTAGNSATQGSDFTPNSGTLNFTGTAGESQTISIQTIDDLVLESNETFYIDLSNATNGVGIADPQGVVSITDNDSASIAISDTVVTEGNSAVLNVTLTNSVSGGFSVDYSTLGSSATSAIDFVANSGTLNFNGTSGETQSITIVTNDDSVVENTESFFVNLSGATNGVNISDNQAVVTISDNDSNPASANITIDDIQINEGENVVFTVTLDASVSGGFTVNYTTSDVSAVEGLDFLGVNGSLTFAGVAGETQTIIIVSLDDTEVEATETFSVFLSNATNNVNIQDPQGTASIIDNDSESEEPVEVTISDGEAQEGGSIFFEVLLSRELPEDLLLYYEVVNESASAEDYNLDVNSVLIRAGETSGQIVVTVLSDEVVEEDETFSIRLLDPANTIVRLADDIAIGTIIDGNSQEEEDIVLSPVPLQSGSDLTVSRIVDGEYFMSLYTYTGQLLLQDQITVANNSYEIQLDDSLASGIFVLEMTNISAGIQYEKLFVISR